MSHVETLEIDAAPAVRRRPRRGMRASLVAGVAAVAVLVASACVPPDFVKHTSGNPVLFSWFAPPSWIASHSTNGIEITDAIGSQFVILAFAPTFCASGSTQQQSAANFFNNMRKAVRDGTGWTSWTTTSASTPVQLGSGFPPNYWRQLMTFTARANNGVTMRGEAELDYQFTGVGAGCAYVNHIRVAPSSQFNNVIARLRSTQNSISYFPPGV